MTVLVGSVSSYLSLLGTQEAYYRESRFAEVWVDVKRARRSVLAKLSEIEGVASLEARGRKGRPGRLDRSEVSVAGRFVSMPAAGEPRLNA